MTVLAMTFALLGVGSTLAVAWLLAAFLPHRHLTVRHNIIQTTDAAGKLSYVSTCELRRPGMIRLMWQPGIGGTGWPQARTELEKVSTLQLRPTVAQDRSWGRLPQALRPGAPASAGMEDARGWPWPALWCSLDSTAIDGSTGARPVIGGLRISRNGVSSGEFRALPLMPIWRGLLLDWAFYSLGWALALPAFRAGRARLRRWRQRCPLCGYSLAGAAASGCPECGWNRAQAPAPPAGRLP